MPVRLACKVVVSPLQIVLVVTSVAVGRGFTVIRSVPVRSLDQLVPVGFKTVGSSGGK